MIRRTCQNPQHSKNCKKNHSNVKQCEQNGAYTNSIGYFFQQINESGRIGKVTQITVTEIFVFKRFVIKIVIIIG